MAYFEYVLQLDISAEEYRRSYSGDAQVVVARDTQGRTIRFPATALRRFVLHDGVRGTFVMRVDEGHKLIDIVKKSG